MTAILKFTDWSQRWTNEEYSLFRHRMRAVQWMGPNVQRRLDQAIAFNWIDLDDPIMPLFKQSLIDEHVLSPARADVIFSMDGVVPAPPTGVAGVDGQVQYNSSGALAGAANFTILNGNPNVTAGNKYLYDGVDIVHGDQANANFYFGNAGPGTSGSYCIGIGKNAMRYATGGQHNIAIGDSALSFGTTGADNVAVGASALISNTSGHDNLALGTNSMYHNTTGYENTAIGRSSLVTNTTGFYNTCNGTYALYYNNSHGYNTAVGYTACYNTDSDANTGVGYQAGYDATTGGHNTFVGMNAGQHVTTGGYNTCIGFNAGLNVAGGGTNTIVGSSAGVAGMTGVVILADGNGLVSFCNDVANGNIGIGPNQYYSSIGGRTGSQCISIGLGSGAGLSSGSVNTFLGANSGKLVTTGNFNTIVGSYAGAPNISNQVFLADGNGSVAIQYDVPNKTWQMPTTTVSALPAAGVVGRRAFVTDAVASSFYTMATGGGTIKVPVFDDGAIWRVG